MIIPCNDAYDKHKLMQAEIERGILNPVKREIREYLLFQTRLPWRFTISLIPDMEVRLDSRGDVVGDLWHGRFLGFLHKLDEFREVSIEESDREAHDTLGLKHSPYPALAPPNRAECSP